MSSQLVHIYCYTSSNISPPSLSLYLPTTLYFTVILPSTFSLSYILTFLFPIIFCINSISFLSFNSYFSHEKNCEYSLSLSLSRFLFFLIILIKVDGFFFFLICVLVLCFLNFSSQSLLSSFYSIG